MRHRRNTRRRERIAMGVAVGAVTSMFGGMVGAAVGLPLWPALLAAGCLALLTFAALTAAE